MDPIFIILFLVLAPFLMYLLVAIWNTLIVNLDEATQYWRDSYDRLPDPYDRRFWDDLQ